VEGASRIATRSSSSTFGITARRRPKVMGRSTRTSSRRMIAMGRSTRARHRIRREVCRWRRCEVVRGGSAVLLRAVAPRGGGRGWEPQRLLNPT